MDVSYSTSQLHAIRAGDGPLALIAGPGCGKTTTLAARIAFLINDRGLDPSSTLVVSFTTEAARRLRREVARLLGDRAGDVAIYTVHALGRHVIDTWSVRLGYEDRPSVLHHQEARALFAATAESLGWDLESIPVDEVMNAADRCRLLADSEARETDPLAPLASAYEDRLRRHGAIDFVAMLSLPLRLFEAHEQALRVLQDAYECVLADESQDLDPAQWRMVELLAARHGNLLVAGDDAQCLPVGTPIRTVDGDVPVESIKVGATVVAASGRGRTSNARVSQAMTRPFSGDLIRIALKSGRELRLTPDHVCFARLGRDPRIHYVYLMYRRGLGYRIGIAVGARLHEKDGSYVNGLVRRTQIEFGDKTWVLRVCFSRSEARLHEQLLSVKYGIPTTLFHVVGRNTMVLSDDDIRYLFDHIDTRANAAQLMADLGLNYAYPHHWPKAFTNANGTARRVRVHLSLFGGGLESPNVSWSFHDVWVNSNDRSIEEDLRARGIQTRGGAKRTWRAERTFRHVTDAAEYANTLVRSIDGAELAQWARLTDGNRFAFHPASHLHPTMILGVLDGDEVVEDEIVAVEREPYTGPVFDLSVENLHNFVAGGVVVHNCLFQWRGADHRAMRRFVERHPDSAVVTLDKNHRSTGRLVDLSNALAELMAGSTLLWTDNAPGPMPRFLLADDEEAEAQFVADQIAALLDRGLLPDPGEAAVIFRTRAQADIVVGALRAAGLPYSLGHGDLFGARVVRDALAYLRLAANPDDRMALARIVDTPRRGLGLLAATLVEEPATANELPARAADFGPEAVSSAAALLATVWDLHAEAVRGATVAQLLDRALHRSGYRAWLERHPDGSRRLRMLGRLRQLAQRVGIPLVEWLDAASVGEDLGPGDEESIRLSSVHLAKGREWRATFLVGVEEGLIPHYRAVAESTSGSDSEALDEELRGLYVALTRARERLYLSACRQRSNGASSESRQPSRWLNALPADLIAPA
jgi:DNA helicase-2/ATP-dependent DNA helicase PcrA